MVRVANRREEEEVFNLAIHTDVLAIPIRPADDEPSLEDMNYWGVELISFAKALRIFPYAGERQRDDRRGSVHHYVVSLGSYQLEAKLFACCKGRIYKGCGSGESLIHFIKHSSPTSLTVVSDYRELTYSLFSRLIQYQHLCGGRTEVGFLTGASRPWVRWSVLKALLLAPQRNEKDLFLFGWKDIGAPNLFHGAQTLWWDDLCPDRIRELLVDKFFLVTLLSHSNGVDGNFSQAILCPIVFNGHSNKTRSPCSLFLQEGLPSCSWSELCQRDPCNVRYRFRPQALSARISFYDTCAGFLAAGSFCSPTVSLGLSFLYGTSAAHVTTIRKKSSNAYLALIFRSFLYDGYTLGWITNQLNRYQNSEFGELPSFVLFGDPLFSLQDKVMNGQGRVVKSVHSINVIGWMSMTRRLGPVVKEEVLVPDTNNQDVFCVDLSARANPRRDWWVFRTYTSVCPVIIKRYDRYNLFERTREVANIFRNGVSFLEILHQGVQRNPAYDADLRLLAAVIEEARALLPTFEQIRQKASAKFWHYAAKIAMQNDIEQALASLNSLNAMVPLAWRAANQWSVLRHFYTNCLDIVGFEQGSHSKCLLCGSWISTKQSANPERAGSLRTSYVCVRCGVVADVPVFASLPAIIGPYRCCPGESITQKFMVVMDIPRGVSVETLLYFGGFGFEVVRCVIQPETIKTTKIRHGRVENVFTLHFDNDCPCGIYSLIAVASALATPLVASKYINVVPLHTKSKRIVS